MTVTTTTRAPRRSIRTAAPRVSLRRGLILSLPRTDHTPPRQHAWIGTLTVRR